MAVSMEFRQLKRLKIQPFENLFEIRCFGMIGVFVHGQMRMHLSPKRDISRQCFELVAPCIPFDFFERPLNPVRAQLHEKAHLLGASRRSIKPWNERSLMPWSTRRVLFQPESALADLGKLEIDSVIT